MEIAEIHGPHKKKVSSFKLLPAEPKKPTTSASTARVKKKTHCRADDVPKRSFTLVSFVC
jgi:hypothetical protein